MFSVQRAVWATARAISDIDLHVGSSTGGGCEWLDLPAERVAVHGFKGSMVQGSLKTRLPYVGQG